MSVVLFHAELETFSGGFVGVDIFFVISGYLITGIILKDLKGGRFSLLDFYERRVRRIFPALFAMLAVCTALSFAFLLPRDLRAFGTHLASASLSLSNISLLAEVDYFDGDAKLKVLLHTWSLAVEEQFYVFWPLMLMILWRGKPILLLVAGSVISLISLAGSVMLLEDHPSEVFYLLPFRAWELLLGALLATGSVPPFRNRSIAAAAAALGLLLVAYAVIFYSDQTAFPGLSAVVPCLGTALIIHAGTGGRTSVVSSLLAMPLLTFFGKISYSLYLWHWPLLALLRYQMIDRPSPARILLVLLLAVVCATVSWRFIELPFRTKQWLRTRHAVLLMGIVAIACGTLAGVVLRISNGLPQRFSVEVNRLAAQGGLTDPYKVCSWKQEFTRDCVIGPHREAHGMLWGDSHAGSLWAAAEAISPVRAIQYAANSACPPAWGIGTSSACIEANRRNLLFAESHPEIDIIILAARWSLYLEGRALDVGPAETNAGLPQLSTEAGHRFERFDSAGRAALTAGLTELVRRLLASGKSVVLVYPVPEVGYDVPFTLARLESRGIDSRDFNIPIGKYRVRQQRAFEMLDGIGRHPRLKRVYPADVLCSPAHCRTNLRGRSLYIDNNHLSPTGARMLAPALLREIG